MENKPSFFQSLRPEQQVSFREWGSLFSLCNNTPPEDIEIGTVIMPTGDWLDRLRPSLKVFSSRYQRQHEKPKLVITGANSFGVGHEGASAPKIWQRLQSLSLPSEIIGNIKIEGDSTNTKEQAENVYGMLQLGEIGGPLVIVVSAYHLPRIVSTFIKTILDKEGENLHTKVYAIPVIKDWKGSVPFEPNDTRRDRIISEMDRVHRYRNQGDVASEEEIQKYVAWLKED